MMTIDIKYINMFFHGIFIDWDIKLQLLVITYTLSL